MNGVARYSATYLCRLFKPSGGGRVAGSVSASLAVHLLAVAVFLGFVYSHPARVINPPGTPSGTRVDLVYLPGTPPASALHTAAKTKPVTVAKLTPSSAPLLPALPLPALPRVTLTPAAPNSSSPSNAPDQTKGSGSWGPDDAQQIALTTYSPRPAPDLSVLPRGLQGNVIVDVTINIDGTVSDLRLRKTLGYGIELSVVNTLRSWTFRPATKDGVPVASEQELIFHFGPA